MDAPTLPSGRVVLASRYGLHPYIRTFAREMDSLSLMGFAGGRPIEEMHSKCFP